MLKVFRQNLKYLSWILWVIIALFVAAIFIGFGDVTSFGKGATSAHVAATVGHDSITREDYQRSYQALERRFQQMYGDQFTPELAKQMQLPLQALTQAVNQKILLAEAVRLGLRATDEEVRERILTAPTFQDDKGHFVGESLYRQFVLEQIHMTPEDFERTLRDDLVLGKLITTLKAGVYISDDEVAKAYRDQVEKAKVRYLELPRGRFVQTDVPQGELAAYYEAHKGELKLPEQREGAYVLVEKAKLLPQVQLDEKVMRDYYDAHAKDFAQQEQVHARHVLAKVDDQHPDALAQKKIADAKRRIEKGEDFAKVAKELSDDPGSKERGGDLGFFGRNAMVKEFEDAAFKAEPHQLVGPIHSNFGYHLIEVLDKRPGGQQPFEQVKQQISTNLALERSQDLAAAKAKEIADRLSRDKPKGPESLEALAKGDPTLTYALTGKFGLNDPVPGIGRLPAFNKAAFELAKGAVSPPVQVGRGWLVLYLTDVQAPKTPALAEVEPKVRQAVMAQRQQQMTLDRLTQAKDEIAKGKTLDQVAGELGLQVKDSQEFGGNGYIPGLGFSPQVAQAALALPTGQIGGPLPAGQGAVLFQVAEHKGADPKELTTKKDQIRDQLANERFERVLTAVIEKRKRDLGVNFNRQFLESFGIQQPLTS
ncbi:MAG TPA: peptidyl-prolyl cis-trans isomerase [Thermoanaerobaculia bacterium]|jgi:peptidyl-prolyl cis-trans isomerase D|nr:peptidyl-prolyl cis-trans isomerase [Thermoanaerobaculia bacterium]